MRPKKQPAVYGGRHAGQSRNLKFQNQPDLTPGALEKSIKDWCINRLTEYHFEGKRTSEHKLALAFWQKSGRRLRGI